MRRVAYTLVVCFTLFTCTMLCLTGCRTPNHQKPGFISGPPSVELRFQVGTMISLKIGGHGQIVSVTTNTKHALYSVRVHTAHGPKIFCFRDYELEIKP